ncbi:hypothetical protein AB433_16435 [Croceicoccus naphthovorans]|uniref:Putative auto-transporter adhesin head GIN domain-containing protein n=2 Tax=Croceicoccus naphthovorans TaxID=1348774 RepID=A0A0G3XMP8_9SPHN|nr:hypothetical protein AB433_16435 [Croceicoccus naphthovorans]
MALATGLAACNAENISMGGKQGVPLEDLDISGAPPKTVAMAGPDTVILREGDTLAITVDGSDAMKAAMRFSLSEIARSKDAPEDETATVNVTMPAPEGLVMAGSGRIRAASMAPTAKVTIAGSGDVDASGIDAESLKVSVVGSGTFKGSGKAERLDLNIAGSGDAAMDTLEFGGADIAITGSGRGAFRSDGDVSAKIVGSGKVRVIGRANCSVKAVGSGKLVCEAA